MRCPRWLLYVEVWDELSGARRGWQRRSIFANIVQSRRERGHARGTVSKRVSSWLGFGLLLALVGAGGAWRGAPERAERGADQTAGISRGPQVPRRPAQAPSRAALFRAVGVVGPSSAELVVIASPPREPSGGAEPPLPCEEPRPLPLQRTGCPEAAPSVQPCSEEGLECRYATAAGCTA